MIYTKDGITTEQLVDLLNLSLEERVMFPDRFVSPGEMVGGVKHLCSDQYKPASVIKFLKIEQVPWSSLEKISEKELTEKLSLCFNVKILVEDRFLEAKSDRIWHRSGIVPYGINVKVNEILNR
jgi:hypothetical protein